MHSVSTVLILVIWVVYFGIFLATIFVGLAFRRAWRRASMSAPLVRAASVVYFLVAGILLLALLGAAAAISAS